MPIRINADLPAKKVLEHENIFVMDYERSLKQDIRPLKIIIMNLMPTKQATELQLLRSLSNTPLQVDITFLKQKHTMHRMNPRPIWKHSIPFSRKSGSSTLMDLSLPAHQ